MILRRWGVEIYDIRRKDPQPTIMVGGRFWTRTGATEYAADRIKGRRMPSNYGFRPVKVADWLKMIR